ncbi:MAG: hypothetical protein RLZZ70_76 [Candidatus Parcubacteria bacterium]|jgi:hypothetical protein
MLKSKKMLTVALYSMSLIITAPAIFALLFLVTGLDLLLPIGQLYSKAMVIMSYIALFGAFGIIKEEVALTICRTIFRVVYPTR